MAASLLGGLGVVEEATKGRFKHGRLGYLGVLSLKPPVEAVEQIGVQRKADHLFESRHDHTAPYT